MNTIKRRMLYRNNNGGQALILSVLFFLSTSLAMVLGTVSPIMSDIDTSEDLVVSKRSFYASESGVEDATYRLIKNLPVSATETITVGGISASTTVSDISGGKSVIANGQEQGLYRSNNTSLATGEGASFFYGIQVGQGGVVLNNTASISGNVYSNGPIVGSGNTITGDVVSAGASGLIEDLTIMGSARAYSIKDSTILQDAYYGCPTSPVTCFSGNTVTGTRYPNSPNQPAIPLPISDADLDEWETSAASGGTISSPCPYIITTNVTLGSRKINCDLYVSNNGVLNLTGPLWVNGTVNFSNSAKIKVAPALGAQSVYIIADRTSNRLSDSYVYLSNTTQFIGSGTPGSYIMMVSRNNSAATGGGNSAMVVSNSVNGDVILYAPNGRIDISNSVSLKEVTAYKLQVNNSAEVIYQSGLADLLFVSGPSGGGYTISGWKEQ